MNLNNELWAEIEDAVNNNSNKLIALDIVGDQENVISSDHMELITDNEGNYTAIAIHKSTKLPEHTYNYLHIYDIASITHIDITTIEEL